MKKMNLRNLVLMLFVLCLIPARAERPGGFRIIGPGGGGAMFHPTISPHDANTVLVACDMTGSYITHDGGKTWRMFNLRGVVDFFVFDPLDAKTIYAHASGLWRSTDGGELWNLVYPDPSSVRGIEMNSDHSDERILAPPDPLQTISAMAIDPSDSRILYVAAGGKNDPGVFISRDYGKTWSKQIELPDRPLHIWVDPRSNARLRTLHLASSKAITTIIGGGITQYSLPGAASDVSLGFGSGPRPTVYATLEDGIFVSKDGGASWTKSVADRTPIQRPRASTTGAPLTWAWDSRWAAPASDICRGITTRSRLMTSAAHRASRGLVLGVMGEFLTSEFRKGQKPAEWKAKLVPARTTQPGR